MRICDVGKAIDGVEDIRQAAWVDGERAVIIDVHKQPGFNINETVQRVKDVLPNLQRSLPPSIKLHVLGERTQTIRASVGDVQFTMAVSIGLVVLVMFVFLRHVRATLIPSVTIPVSLLCTCAVMYLCNYTIDNVSLMALTIAVGFIIDDAVVMVENIIRHIEDGKRPLQAALVGSGEVGFTILSMTLSLISVFIPLLLMGGLIGRLFREFAVTVSVAILMSGAVSLTLTPMMCGWLLRPAHAGGQDWRIVTYLEAVYQRSLAGYTVSLRWALRHRLFMLALMAATMAATVVLYKVIPKGFFPQQDNGIILGTAEAGQDISYAAMVERVHEMAKVVGQDPDVQTVWYWVGANPTVNTGRISVELKPFDQRKSTSTQIVARLRKATVRLPGIAFFGQARQDVQIGTRVSKTQYQYTLQDPDVAELFKWAPIVMAKLATLPELTDVTGDLQASAPRMMLKIDRDAIGRLGITPQLIDDTLYDAFGQRQVATVFGQLDQHRVILEVDPSFQEDASSLAKLYVRSALGGQMVPLSVLTRSEVSVSPLTINHQDQFPSVTLSFNLAPGHSLGDALVAIADMERSIAKPAALTAVYQGSAKVFEIIARHAALPDRRRHHRGLHRARHPVRELHPSDHHSLDPAVGRRGRVPGPDAAALRLLADRADRHDPPGRHREEERHHDDRLRPGGRARARADPRAVDLRGLPAALPPHHDDHHGGAARRPAAGAGHRSRLRAAPPARHRHRGRAAAVAVPDALYDAGDLHLPEQDRVAAAPGGGAGRRGRDRPAAGGGMRSAPSARHRVWPALRGGR